MLSLSGFFQKEKESGKRERESGGQQSIQRSLMPPKMIETQNTTEQGMEEYFVRGACTLIIILQKYNGSSVCHRPCHVTFGDDNQIYARIL